MKFREKMNTPERGGITEKYLYRMLVTSICSIFLCMACLAGTTWAWFMASIENEENVIHVGTPSVIVKSSDYEEVPEGETLSETELDSGTLFPAGAYVIHVTESREADVFGQKSTLYVTFSVEDTAVGYVALNADNSYQADVAIETNQDCVIFWDVSWAVPEDVELLEDNQLWWYVEEDPAGDETTQTPGDDDPETDDPVTDGFEEIPGTDDSGEDGSEQGPGTEDADSGDDNQEEIVEPSEEIVFEEIIEIPEEETT